MKQFAQCIFISVMLLTNIPLVYGQKPDGGGHYEHSTLPCITDAQRIEMEKTIQTNRAILLKAGILKKPKKNRSVSLSWPLQQAAGFDYCSYYGISNFVDHNSAFPNQVLDFNCGSRTYDLASGYNHGGIDIFLFPFDWNMKNAGQVEVIAASPGVIVAKYDGNSDNNCDFSNPNWNAVYIEHADGSIAWYGHMKNGSLLTKAVGASVVTGEKLGLVASSGSSTGPHLHFELHDLGGNVIDPYDGACNPGGANLWAIPRSYYEPTINVALTHSAPPVFNTCPNVHTTNIADTFYALDDIYFAGYFHDQLINNTATYTVRRPDNSIFATWSQTPNVYYQASYWYWQYTLPPNPMFGTWTFSIAMNGQTCTHTFTVKDPAATAITSFDKVNSILQVHPNPANDKIRVDGADEIIEIYSLQGQLISQYFKATTIDISNFTNGLYVIKSGAKVAKVMIAH